MNRETPVAYDYAAKGAQDFAAGRKDERLYGNGENHGASYRHGWQQARRDAEASQDPRPEPAPVEAKEPPGVICPNCNRHTTGGLFGHENDPKEGEAKFTTTHCGCYHEPNGGERFTAVADAKWDEAVKKPAPVTAEDVRLQTGEDKPKKPKPSNPDQLAFF